MPDPARVDAVRAAVAAAPGVESVRPVKQSPEDGVLLAAVLERDPFSTEAFDLIPGIRAAAKRAGGPQTLVGGGTAVEYDLRQAAARDNKVIVPIALLVVLLILILLLRALVAPLMLIATVVLSFAASLGVAAVVFDVIFGFPGSDPVAAAVRLHLPRRAGDRLQHLPHGARPRGDAPVQARATGCCAAWR